MTVGVVVGTYSSIFIASPILIEVARSRAFLVKKDIFRNLMWYTMPDSNKQYPLSIEGAKKIKDLNRQGIRPEELETVEVISGKPKEVEPEYADVVGQISLKSLEKNSRKRRDRERSQQQNRGAGQNQQGNNQQNRGGHNRNSNQQGKGNQNQQRPNQQNRQQRSPQNRGGQNQHKPDQGAGNSENN